MATVPNGLRVLHRSDRFRLLEYHCDGHHEDSPAETTRQTEIVLVQSGAFVRQDQDAKSFMDETAVGVFAAGGTYRISHFGARPDLCTIIALRDPHSFGEFAQPNRPLLVRADPAIYALHHRMLRAAREQSIDLEARVDHLLDHVELLARSGDRLDVAVPDWRFADDVLFVVLDHIHRRHERSVKLSDIAARAGYSPFHLSRYFKTRMGCTIQQYVGMLRMAGATTMLADSAMPTTEIALALGYSSPSHFSDRFRRWAGVPPTAWRRQVTED